MLLSIITINLNNAPGLQKTLESILLQTSRNFEWIVIDGASTDESVALIENNLKHINYWISEPDQGIYSAMNKGVLAARGEYVLFLNSGDYFADGQVIDYFAQKHQPSDFVVGNVVLEGAKDKREEAVLSPSSEEEVFHLCISAFPHQAMFIRRDVFEEYGLYREDKRIASDWYQTINALFKGNATVSHLPLLVSICEKDGISSRLSREMYQERKELIRENPYFAVLFEFYSDNREIVTALKSNRFVFFLFRVYYFFYRKLKVHY
jgi:glycosyltransferase involved in cell wall biosynthesis